MIKTKLLNLETALVKSFKEKGFFYAKRISLERLYFKIFEYKNVLYINYMNLISGLCE